MDLLAINNSQDVIAARTAAIRESVLRESRCIRQPNFERIATDDLARLFSLYDRGFFGGWLGQAVKDRTGAAVVFSLSSRMTRAGGKTIRHWRSWQRVLLVTHYEIAIASRLLFMTFGGIERPVAVCGLACTDRLQALQRIMEHEIIHLAEMIVWDESSCSRPRFRKLAERIFGHKDAKHDLVTPREQAFVQHGLRVGSMVGFEFQGRSQVGRVNRISRRATVLVEDGGGMAYSDGKKYRKYYVPVDLLRLMGKHS
ncbi:MAG: SprT-like family protein [Phycisphaerae bacterium]